MKQESEINSYDKQLGIHAPEQEGHDIVDLSARDETRRAEAVGLAQRVINKLRDDVKPYFETQEPPLVIHPGGITEHDMNLEAVPEMNNPLEKSMNGLDDDGVQLLLENMPPLP